MGDRATALRFAAVAAVALEARVSCHPAASMGRPVGRGVLTHGLIFSVGSARKRIGGISRWWFQRVVLPSGGLEKKSHPFSVILKAGHVPGRWFEAKPILIQ